MKFFKTWLEWEKKKRRMKELGIKRMERRIVIKRYIFLF